jgi:hypothetical protein
VLVVAKQKNTVAEIASDIFQVHALNLRVVNYNVTRYNIRGQLNLKRIGAHL